MKILFAPLLLCLLLSACSSKKDDPSTPTLVGTWTGVSVRFQADYTAPSYHDYDYTDKLTGNTLTFTADHKVTSVTPLSGTNTGTYAYNAPTLTLQYPTYTVSLKVVELKEASLITSEIHQDQSGTFTTTTTRSR